MQGRASGNVGNHRAAHRDAAKPRTPGAPDGVEPALLERKPHPSHAVVLPRYLRHRPPCVGRHWARIQSEREALPPRVPR